MCAIDCNGLVARELKTGSFNSSAFIEFVELKLASYFRANPRKILVMDNARIHKTADVERLSSNNGIAFKYTTPYSPE